MFFRTRLESDNIYIVITVAPIAWVLWVPRNPSISEQWVPEPIQFLAIETLNYPFYNKKQRMNYVSNYDEANQT